MVSCARRLHLYSANYSDFDASRLLDDCLPWLDPGELVRYQGYRQERQRRRFLIGRLLLRQTLSRYRDCAPENWAFKIGRFGKPELAEQGGGEPLHFNLSHTDDLLLILIGCPELLGVDVENADRVRRVFRIARRYFTAREVEELGGLTGSEQLQRFYRLWTLKEAYLKARGLGLSGHLDRFSFGFSAGGSLTFDVHASMKDSPGRWRFWQFGMGPGFEAAVAVSAAETKALRLQHFRWRSPATVTEQRLPVQWRFG